MCSDGSPLTPRKYTVLNGSFVFGLHSFDLNDVFQECNHDIKGYMSVFSFVVYAYEIHKATSVVSCEVYGHGSEIGKSHFTLVMYSEFGVL
jgi:hypothetical protein